MCGQPGHISRNCMATVICDTCGGRGHMAYDRPSARVFDRGVRRY
jgi:cellular nucleic acid-binding protein